MEATLKPRKHGFDMKKLSIVGKDYHTEEHVVGFYNAGDRMKRWGKSGAFWGGFWGLLVGSAKLFPPAQPVIQVHRHLELRAAQFSNVFRNQSIDRTHICIQAPGRRRHATSRHGRWCLLKAIITSIHQHILKAQNVG
jgi:hypothetical protein